MKIVYKIIRKISLFNGTTSISNLRTRFAFWGNDVIYSSFRSKGCPIINTKEPNSIIIGDNFAMNNGRYGNNIGFHVPCSLITERGCKIIIGNNVGISQTTLIAHSDIIIGDNVKIGGGTVIYTSDFHSLDANIRRGKEDVLYRKSAPVKIGEDAFIGAGSIILKGVTIGERSIVGAGSVVVKSIPSDEIWGGNPARFIKKI